MRPQFQRRVCRPREHMLAAGKLYPDAWLGLDRIRAGRGDDVPAWPDWCYAPIGATQAIVASDAGIPGEDIGQHLDLILDADRIAALAAWRMTQGIYRFDADLYEAVIDTPVGNLPHEILFRLPEWCVYIETPGVELDAMSMAGFFAHLEYDIHAHRSELRFIFDLDAPAGAMLAPMALHLGQWTLDEALSRMLDVADSHGVEVPRAEIRSSLHRALETGVNLLLYLCSQAEQIGDERRRPGNPQPKRVKGRWRLFPADGARTWDVGVRMGAALRRAREAARSQEDGASEIARQGPRPHIRRAHWHGYWSGPLDGPRTYDLRWMPPIPVNLDNAGEMPATIRRVKERE